MQRRRTFDETVDDLAAVDEDENIVEEIGEAAGVLYDDREPLRAGVKEHRRDEHRWELDPASSEDYGERTHAVGEPREPIRHMGHRDRYGKDPS
jgi:uncharacterized protein DUF6335